MVARRKREKHSQLGLDALKRSDCQKGLGKARTKSSHHRPRPRYLAILILKGRLNSVKCNEPCQLSQVLDGKSNRGCLGRTNSGLQRVTDNKSGAARVPLRAKGRPWQFLAGRESAIELRAGLCDCGSISQMCFEGRERPQYTLSWIGDCCKKVSFCFMTHAGGIPYRSPRLQPWSPQ